MKKLHEEIVKLFACFGRTIDEITLSAWLDVLGEYPIQKVCEAFDILKKSPEQFPTTGKVISLIEQPDQKMIEAWQEVHRSARNGGRNPIHARAAKALSFCGGMIRLMDAHDSELPWIKKEFERVYKQIPESATVDDVSCAGLEGAVLPDIKIKVLNGAN